MIISKFTLPELQYFEKHCNFTDIELSVFRLRSQGASLDDVAFILRITKDKAKKLSQKVNRKIIKAL